MKRAARIDENQNEIVVALLDAGCRVQSLAPVGLGCPDLLVGFRGRNLLIEVKNPAVPRADQALTKDQKSWHATWKGQVAIVYTRQDALNLIARTIIESGTEAPGR